jgi:hypothetical protein
MKRIILLLLLPISLLWADFGIKSQCELHAKYQSLKFGLQDALTYLRMDQVLYLPKTWELYLRLDVPYMWLWGVEKQLISIGDDGIIVSPDTRGAHTMMRKTAFQEHGLSDLLIRAFFVTPSVNQSGSITLGFGSEFTFPTAQDVDLGSGKYAARPVVGFKWDLPTVGKGGSWFALLSKYLFSFAGNKSRPSYQILFFQPVFIYNFAIDWALVLAPELQYNILQPGWFIPASATLARNIGKHFSCSVTYQKGLVTKYPVFQQEVELVLRYGY